MTALEPFRDRLKAMKGKPAVWYITEPAKAEDDLLDAKEDVYDKIKSFMAGRAEGHLRRCARHAHAAGREPRLC